MKIFIISDYWQPLEINKYLGGSEAFTVETWLGLNEAGHECYLIGPGDSKIDSDKFYPVMADSKNKFSAENPGKRFNPTHRFNEALGFVKSKKPDVIITSVSNVKMLRELIKLNIPILHFSHTIIYYRNDPDRFQKYLNMSKEFKHIKFLAVSNYLKNNINSMFPDLISDFIHPTFFTPTVNFISNLNTNNRVIYAGRVTATKMVDILVKCTYDSKFNVDLFGDRQHYPEGEEKWYNENILPYLDKNINHYPNKSHSELMKELSVYSCYVTPTYTETFSLSSFEAQRLGVPVIHIAKKEPEGIEEYLQDGKTGYVIYTHRKRINKVREELLEKLELVKSLDRKYIFDYFKENYSRENYINKLSNISSKFIYDNEAKDLK